MSQIGFLGELNSDVLSAAQCDVKSNSDSVDEKVSESGKQPQSVTAVGKFCKDAAKYRNNRSGCSKVPCCLDPVVRKVCPAPLPPPPSAASTYFYKTCSDQGKNSSYSKDEPAEKQPLCPQTRCPKYAQQDSSCCMDLNFNSEQCCRKRKNAQLVECSQESFKPTQSTIDARVREVQEMLAQSEDCCSKVSKEDCGKVQCDPKGKYRLEKDNIVHKMSSCDLSKCLEKAMLNRDTSEYQLFKNADEADNYRRMVAELIKERPNASTKIDELYNFCDETCKLIRMIQAESQNIQNGVVNGYGRLEKLLHELLECRMKAISGQFGELLNRNNSTEPQKAESRDASTQTEDKDPSVK